MSEGSTGAHRTREVLLNVGAMVGVMSMLMAATALVFGITPLIFRSGSMAPAVHTGDLGIAQTVPAADLRAGDIVTVFTSGGVRVTHRIVELDQTDSGVLLVLKGDANDDPDPEQYAVTEAERLLFAVPRAGYVASWLSGPGGVFLGGLLVGLVLLAIFRRPSATPPSGRRRADTAARTGTLTLGAVLVALPLVAHPPQAVGTLAAWNDSVDVTGATTTGYTVPAPAYNQTCTLGGSGSSRTVRYSWPANVAPLPLLSYDIVASGITSTSSVSTGGSTTSVTISYTTGGANNNQIVTLTAVGWPTGASAWKSAATTKWKFRTNGNNAAATCGEIDPPDVTFTQPVDGSTSPRNAQISGLVTPCASTPACGTISDSSTVTPREYRFERTIAGTVTCWNGSGWSTQNCTTTWRAVTGTAPAWRVGGTAALAYTSAGVYSLTIRATDAYLNVGTETITFTLT
ncbi:hypothetical protein NSZ01_18610 [Nocardioides szechwanensis]|uniref:Signal peptidase I n=1 Tax=Nocardioides szechwanensis TaxID=1005944 RepID=A0A1H0GWX1_9ACTN|nr:signal peptidase I [Nocardioides szechwanensis]GEP34093.1 hypothetical protein NSZ01_18610 [Nocardioides szechwanensis]SDO11390.1 signal peptidase I [Nocardioides szechwanensis]